MAQDDLAHDRYDAAWQITRTLMEQQCDEKILYDLAGTAAFAVQEFELAEQYLKEAEALGVLDSGKDHLPYVSELKGLWETEQQIRQQEAQADDLPRVRICRPTRETSSSNCLKTRPPKPWAISSTSSRMASTTD